MLIFGGLLLPVCRLVCSFGQFLATWSHDASAELQYADILVSPRVIYTYCNARTAMILYIGTIALMEYIVPGGAFDTPTKVGYQELFSCTVMCDK